jgi:uncharacterized protein (TIGR02001 family)
LSGAALAEDKLTWSATATGTSDYVFRGISQTDNDPTIQGSVGIAYGMFYAGAWASGLDWTANGSDAELEVDWYGGVKPTWGPATFDFGVIYYTYPGSNDQGFPENDYLEWKAGVTGELMKGLTGGATFYYSDDVLDHKSYVYEGTLAYALPTVWVVAPTVSGLVGHADYDGPLLVDYTYWNAGLALTVEHLTFDFRYWDTDLSEGPAADCSAYFVGGHVCDERFVFTATVAMP